MDIGRIEFGTKSKVAVAVGGTAVLLVALRALSGRPANSLVVDGSLNSNIGHIVRIIEKGIKRDELVAEIAHYALADGSLSSLTKASHWKAWFDGFAEAHPNHSLVQRVGNNSIWWGLERMGWERQPPPIPLAQYEALKALYEEN